MSIENAPDRGDGSAARARVGTVIEGAWTLEALLGVGGMAAVYRAIHTNGDRRAFKILHRRHVHDTEMLGRFLQEPEVVAAIRHPACVRMYGAARTDDGTPLLVMELLEGESLEAMARRSRPFPLEEVLRIASVLLELLEASHAADVIHRDLTPANVVVTPRGDVKLFDFGVARFGGRRRTQGRRAIGTPAFMAPEQARGDAIDGRADLFAVGAILFTLLARRPLRRGVDDESLSRAAREAAIALPVVAPHVPPDVARLVDKALAWNPVDRWPNARAMRNEVDRLRIALARETARPFPHAVVDDASPARLSMRVDPRVEQDDEELNRHDRVTQPSTPWSLAQEIDG